MSLDAKFIGARIKRLRTAKGLSQVELGKEISTNGTVVCLWETGKVLPSLRFRRKLATFFGVEIEFLSSDGTERVAELREKAITRSKEIFEDKNASTGGLGIATKVALQNPSDAEKAANAREEQFRQLMKGAHERLLRKLSRLRTEVGYE